MKGGTCLLTSLHFHERFLTSVKWPECSFSQVGLAGSARTLDLCALMPWLGCSHTIHAMASELEQLKKSWGRGTRDQSD